MIDRLIEKIDKTKNPTVVGLDPTYEMIPEKIKNEKLEQYGKTPKAVAEMFVSFNKVLIDSLYDIVPAIKPQIAMYEKYGVDGISAYIKTNSYAKEKGMVVIGDIKRGDISSTAEAYAAHLAGTEIEGERFDIWNTDAVTLNPYMGFDAIEPFIKPCNEYDKGMFVLVKTSNPSGVDLQGAEVSAIFGTLKEKLSVLFSNPSSLYEVTARLVDKWGKLAMGQNGYSKIGAVVGATNWHSGYSDDAARKMLRELMPNTFFLVPGYGAQGGKAEDIRDFFDKDGRGVIVNSSRGIIAAYKSDDKYCDDDFGEAARDAATAMKTALTF